MIRLTINSYSNERGDKRQIMTKNSDSSPVATLVPHNPAPDIVSPISRAAGHDIDQSLFQPKSERRERSEN